MNIFFQNHFMATFLMMSLRPHPPAELSTSIFVLTLRSHFFSSKSDRQDGCSGSAVCSHVLDFLLGICLILLLYPASPPAFFQKPIFYQI